VRRASPRPATTMHRWCSAARHRPQSSLLPPRASARPAISTTRATAAPFQALAMPMRPTTTATITGRIGGGSTADIIPITGSTGFLMASPVARPGGEMSGGERSVLVTRPSMALATASPMLAGSATASVQTRTEDSPSVGQKASGRPTGPSTRGHAPARAHGKDGSRLWVNSPCFSLFFQKFTASGTSSAAEILGFRWLARKNNSEKPAVLSLFSLFLAKR
jgi:hypothetical protein